MVKQLRQVAGVEQVKVEDFKQGIFAVTPGRGERLLESELRDAVRRSGFTLDRIVTPEGSEERASKTRARSSDLSEQLMAARATFRKGQYEQALDLTRGLLKQLPDKTAEDKARLGEVGQFFSLTYFALGKYDDASTAAHTALHRGGAWDWKELSGHYTKVDHYTRQLRRLEKRVRQAPSLQSRFLLGYHYLMLGHREAARAQLTRVVKDKHEDKLVASLLKRLAEEESKNPPSQPGSQ